MTRHVGRGGADREDATADLIADLVHYGDANAIDFLDEIRRGIDYWRVEQRDPDSIDELPDMKINVERLQANGGI